MKKIVLLFLFALTSALVVAQTRYEVIVSIVNVRDTANGKIVGTIQKGQRVEVYSVENGWAKIAFQNKYAYANVSYLKKLPSAPSTRTSSSKSTSKSTPAPVVKEQSSDYTIGDIFKDFLYLFNEEWWVFVIFGLSFVLWILRKFIRGENEVFEGGPCVAHTVIFILVCALELLYGSQLLEDSLWFCIPDDVGWWCVLTFPLFGYVVYNQFMCYIDALNDFRWNQGDFELKWGWYSALIGIAIAVVCEIWFEKATLWVLIATGVCQLVQFFLIFVGVADAKGKKPDDAAFMMALVGILLYFLGLVATLAMLASFLVLLVVVVVIGFFVVAFLSGGKSSSRSSSGSKEGYIETSNGRRIYGSFDNNEEYFEGEGRRFRYRSGYGDWEEY